LLTTEVPDGSAVVPAEFTYCERLKTQPASFQNDAIGPKRAGLLRNGGLTAKPFSNLSLGLNFQPLTPEEMKRKEPGAFERGRRSVERIKKICIPG
jgi:hypothetical protein